MGKEREFVRRHYAREEEFLAERGYGMAIGEVLKALSPDTWIPDEACNDNTRRNTEYFLKAGELTALSFDSATVYDTADGFSRLQVCLKSSKRMINIEVGKDGGKLVGKKLFDGEPK
jgi:hypothetical protein